MNAIEVNRFSRTWTRLADALPRPVAILCISAHWETAGARVTAQQWPPTIHDFRGFPSALSAVTYPAPGSPLLAERILQLASDISLDDGWGLDHGSWSVLRTLWPDASIPVVQLSLDRGRSPAQHLALARSLAPLRQEGVLVLGSGNLVHNLQELMGGEESHGWARRVDALLAERIKANDLEALLDPWALDPEARRAIPSLEHYLPLLYVLGLRERHEPLTMFCPEVTLGAIGMRSVLLGQALLPTTPAAPGTPPGHAGS